MSQIEILTQATNQEKILLEKLKIQMNILP